MKNKLVILVAAMIMLGLASCNDKPTDLYRQIECIDSAIMWKNELLAKKMLDSIDMSIANKNDSAYYNLIKLKLDYQLPSSSKIDSLFDLTEQYYSYHRDRRKLVQTLFYRSAYYCYNNKYSKSQDYLASAEQMAIDYEFTMELSLINWLKLLLCYYTNDLEKAKVYSDRQLNYSLLSGNKAQLSYAFLNRAFLYRQLNQNDSACDWYHKAIVMDNWINPSDMSFVYNALGELLISSDSVGALYYFKKSVERRPNPMAECNIAKYYLNQNRFAEAESISVANINGDWPEQNIEFLDIAVKCRLYDSDTGKALIYSQMIANQKDSIISRINGTKTNQEAPTNHNVVSVAVFIFSLLSVLIVFVVTIFFIIRRYKNNTRNIEDNYLKSKSQIADLKAVVAQKERREIEMHKQLSDYNRINVEGAYLMKKIEENIHFDAKDLKNVNLLRAYYAFNNPDFVEKIGKCYTNLTDNQLLYLILCDCGKSETEMMSILGIESSSLRSIKSRIKSRNQ
ncbi:MAG: hypothetical protein IKQ70_00295 [Bacteroidales bacterium]|nr:hypothetical protein [Bacteroidales bacterium]